MEMFDEEGGTPDPVLQVAQANRVDGDSDIVTLSTGYRAKLRPVAATLIDQVTAKIKDPEIPIVEIPDKNRSEPNPNDPQYKADLAEAERQRGLAAMDAMLMFGVDLVDPIPTDGQWIKKLKVIGIDISGYDLEDELEQEFVFKKYIAVSNDDLYEVASLSGVRRDAIDAAKKDSE